MPETLNDVHSRLSATTVASVICPESIDEVVAAVQQADKQGMKISVSGGRHAMGGQPFGEGTLHIDCRGLNRFLEFDRQSGLLRIEAGVTWPGIIQASHEAQGDNIQWGIRQKQTGADDLTLAGAISANAHGRGLQMSPIGEDIEDITLVTAGGEVLTCSRDDHSELFSHVIGGYGMFGIIVAATLRLGQRMKLRRVVDIIDIDDAMNAVYRRIGEGCLYGDFQYAIDPLDDDAFLRRGVFACYKPCPDGNVDDDAADLSQESWLALLQLAHTDKREAFRAYSAHYLNSHGRVYWSDSMQLSTYIPSYAEFLADALPRDAPESLMITELYVPPQRLIDFTAAARAVLRRTCVEDIYGTIRAIRVDTTSALPWARDDQACVIFNLRTPHTEQGIANTRTACRDLIDAATELGGSFFLTYHRWATPEQVVRCYPEFPAFVAAKHKFDPNEMFVSEWWRTYRCIGELGR